MCNFRILLAVVMMGSVASSTYARDHEHHHHHHGDKRVVISVPYFYGEYVYESDSPRVYESDDEAPMPLIDGRPISADEADQIEADDAEAGDKADRAADAERNRRAQAGKITRYPNIDIKNLSRDGNVWIGGEPTLKGYRQVHDRGVDAVVDLRTRTLVQRESAREAARLGMDYISLPITPKNMSARDADAFMRFMSKHRGDQVLIHCGSANRASAMYAVYLAMGKGLSPDQAIGRARQTGLKEASLERDVRDYLESHRAPEPAGSKEDRKRD